MIIDVQRENNMQMMREALEHALYFLRRHHMGAVYAPDGETLISCEDVISVVDNALSSPPRNCDAKYADRVEMYGAFKDWCKAKGHTMEPMLAYDAFDWLLATVAE